MTSVKAQVTGVPRWTTRASARWAPSPATTGIPPRCARDPAGFDDKVAAGCAASERFEATGDLLTIPAPGTFDDRRSRRRGGSAGGDVQAAVAVADLDRLGITDGKRLVAQPHRDRV